MNEDIIKAYDDYAEEYDGHYLHLGALLENSMVAAVIKDVLPAGGYILDVGCGTGLDFELLEPDPEKYFGVDPSIGMLKKFAEKHPDVSTEQRTFEDWFNYHEEWTFDGLMSLFGSASYIDAHYTEKIFEIAPNLVLMYYKENYWPDFKSKPPTMDEARETAMRITRELGGEVLLLNSFQICVLKRS